MKWWEKPIGKGDLSEHMVRVYGRGQSRGIFISASSYTEPAVTLCRDHLKSIVVVLCELKEFVFLLEKESDIKQYLKEKINAAIIDKNPLHKPLENSVVHPLS